MKSLEMLEAKVTLLKVGFSTVCLMRMAYGVPATMDVAAFILMVVPS